MARYDESVRAVLQDVENYLNVSLSGVKLSSKQQNERQGIIQRIVCLRGDWPQLGAAGDGPTYDDLADLPHSPSLDHDTSKDGAHTDDDLDSPNIGFQKDQIPPTPAESLCPEIAGYLAKKRKGARITSRLGAQNRWCAVKDGVFYYYLRDISKSQRGAFKLNGYHAYPSNDSKREYEFDLTCSAKRTYMFQCNDRITLEKWVRKLNEVLRSLDRNSPYGESEGNPFVPDPDSYDDTDVPGPGPPEYYEDVQVDPYTTQDTGVSHKAGRSVPVSYEDAVEYLNPLPKRPPLDPPQGDNIEGFYDDTSAPGDTSYEGSKPGDYIDDSAVYNNGSDEGFSSSSDTGSVGRSRVGPGYGHTHRDPYAPLPPLPSASGANLPQAGPSSVIPHQHHVHQPELPPRPRPQPQHSVLSNVHSSITLELQKKIKMGLHTGTPSGGLPRRDPKLKNSCYSKLYWAKWDCLCLRPDELEFQRGDLIKIIDKTYDFCSWWTGVLNGNVGLVPKNLLVACYMVDK